MKKRDFSSKANSIITKKPPQSMGELLTGKVDAPSETIAILPNQPSKQAKKETRKLENYKSSKEHTTPPIKKKTIETEVEPTIQENFQFPQSLSDRLTDCVAAEKKKDRSTTRRAIVTQALDALLKKKGF